MQAPTACKISTLLIRLLENMPCGVSSLWAPAVELVGNISAAAHETSLLGLIAMTCNMKQSIQPS